MIHKAICFKCLGQYNISIKANRYICPACTAKNIKEFEKKYGSETTDTEQ